MSAGCGPSSSAAACAAQSGAIGSGPIHLTTTGYRTRWPMLARRCPSTTGSPRCEAGPAANNATAGCTGPVTGRGDRPMRDLQEKDMVQIQLVADDLVAAHRLHSRPSGWRLIAPGAALAAPLRVFATPFLPPR